MRPMAPHLAATFVALVMWGAPASRADFPAAPPAEAPRGPVVALLTAGFGAPTGLMGATVGWEFAPDWALETGLGLGLTGYQVPLMVRWFTPLLARSGPRDGSLGAFSIAAGPSAGLITRSLGLNVPHDEGRTVDEDALYAAVWFNIEAAWEARASWGGMIRVNLGIAPRIYENMAGLCSPAVEGPDGSIPVTDCDPPHFASGPRVANAPFLAYLGVSLGWEFGR